MGAVCKAEDQLTHADQLAVELRDHDEPPGFFHLVEPLSRFLRPGFPGRRILSCKNFRLLRRRCATDRRAELRRGHPENDVPRRPGRKARDRQLHVALGGGQRHELRVRCLDRMR